MANNRIFYAVQKVGLKSIGDTGDFVQLHGVQSVGMTTNFNLEQVFELGQIQIYENIENIPDVEVTMTKVLDGYPPLFCSATRGYGDSGSATRPSTPALNGRANMRSVFALAIYPDTNTEASGTPKSQVECSGMYVSNVSYTFPVDGNFSEDLTLVGNDKVWAGDSNIAAGSTVDLDFTGGLDGTDSPPGTGGVNRRENIIFTNDPAAGTDENGMSNDVHCTILPPTVYGVSSSGTVEEQTNDAFEVHVSTITCSVDLGREEINELGRRAPYYRFATYPVEVTSEIEVTSSSGDMVSATERGILSPVDIGDCEDSGNLAHATIRVATCEGLRLYTGLRNKLASVNYTGGDSGGGNVSVTYTYTTFNDFTVMHYNDPVAAIDDVFDPAHAKGVLNLYN